MASSFAQSTFVESTRIDGEFSSATSLERTVTGPPHAPPFDTKWGPAPVVQ